MKQSNKINFKGQNIYIGIDVHLKSWHITIMTDFGFKRKHSQPASASMLIEHLRNNYPEGNYHAIYESGFTGFSTYYSLAEHGIDCVIAHAADIPTGQNESVMKSDAVDSEKLARTLRDNSLKNTVHIPSRGILDHRGVVRYRKHLQDTMSGCKARIKHLLYSNGVVIPECFSSSRSHWSRSFMQWLKNDVELLSPTKRTLEWQLEHIEILRSEVLAITREIRELSRSEYYDDKIRLIRSVPGIGLITGMTLLVELENVERFGSERSFASYLGLVPTCRNSGEKTRTGEITFRGNNRLRIMLIESSWVAIGRDIALAAAYSNFCKRMKPQNAIIRIARKLSNRIFAVLKSGNIYEYDKCCQ